MYLHTYDWRCHQYLQWYGSRRLKISYLLCPICGHQYPVAGKTRHRLPGGSMCLAAVEEQRKRK